MRVIAIKSLKDGVLRIYGEGEYIGYKVPNFAPYPQFNLVHPCIKLDTGKYIWGFQCWWCSVEEFESRHKGHIKETITVEVEDEILPVEVKP